jgi:pectate disaccharide-lyase
MKMSSFSGNGNGFKLGGNGTGGSSKGTHVVKRSIAFDKGSAPDLGPFEH